MTAADVRQQAIELIESVRDRPAITRMSHANQLSKIEQLRDALAGLIRETDNTGEDGEQYQAVCGSWDCRAPECRLKGIQ